MTAPTNKTMLRHEDHSQAAASPSPAAQVHVTPEELAAAISRIEARKDAGRRESEGTISIGEAVQQLGLEATPDEVLAEVEAERRQRAIPKKRRPSIGRRFFLALGLSGIILGLAVDMHGLQQMQTQSPINTATVSSDSRPILLDPNLIVGDVSGNLAMLSEVGENQPVHCTFDNHSSAFNQYSPENPQALWTLIKHSGQVYVRGYRLKMSPRVLRANGADISAHPDSHFVIPVTLPLSGFRVTPEVGSPVEFHAQDVRSDQHIYEKWQP